jgi:hypothetical protein
MSNVVEIIDTVVWSDLKWKESCEKIAHIDQLLPQIGQKVVLPLHFNQQQPKDGKATIVWKPPHSELNGWSDKRPSDILKSYLIEGNIVTGPAESSNFEFVVTGHEKLTAALEKLKRTDESLFHSSPSRLGWHKARQLKHALVGNYIYIFGEYQEIELEAILSRNDQNLCLHYSAFKPSPSQHETVLLRSYLTGEERSIIEKAIIRSRIIEDNASCDLSENQVYGVEYF